MPLTCTMGSSLETLRFEVDNIPMLVSLGLWTEIDNLDHSSNNAPDPLHIDLLIYLLCLMPLSAIFQLYHGDQF